MSVEIDPQELGFHRPFTVEVKEALSIKNPNSHPIAFKVKTTAPKQYCVRPNSGRVEPGKEVEVAVILQAMKHEPPPDTKCRDKFLVQSVEITGDKEFANLSAIWDSVPKSSVVERKIRVSFINAPSNAAQLSTPSKPTTSSGADATPADAPPPAYSSPNDQSTSADYKDEDEVRSPSAGLSTTAASSSGRELSYAELKQQLDQAEQLVSRLKADQGGLRQRKTGAEEKSVSKPAELAQQVRGTEGVPIQITAALCLLSFLLAYFFF
ncbi:PapD-like protein [Microdochium trichocladiopsis]|uniref:PapD-like protein n=1 Tax=Microdochium trichocladiopsis TaxID=1682393 RepID=A0A9P8XYC0_9PEZI|nr:PapD-like protein [Microdochium trichocladiopsis]KAH7025920.1 PapD-like protein [Microdochium trichocladiopsis]